MALTAIILSTVLASADNMAKGKADAKKPINCPSAKADIRVLNNVKEYDKMLDDKIAEIKRVCHIK